MPVDVITVPRSIAGEQNGHYPLNGVFGLPDLTHLPNCARLRYRPAIVRISSTSFITSVTWKDNFADRLH
ncbi:hypothetical protein CBS63078_4984 [Aspergillus niger]|nr:hypothetical protein CBS12448_5205 [Aspergillus niger]KAI2898169.1 hypothetical protein CBS13152_2948 [Aspergillus niger]KAI2906478.1 hypothetical protein CBS11852_902 [Aspergillus niger]KAI2906820.1 hypothetical protein CBS63078_4984 [Aspergillus niger]KAI2929521.1 hypothetical protein CBS147320_3854 [Aspergillus niger]